jgi:capsular polysaccharide transport system permease protein
VKARSPFEVTLSVWRALFLHEAVGLFFRGRAAWLWLLAEPIVYMLVHVFGLESLRINEIGGITINVWIAVAFFAFLIWRYTWVEVMHSADASRSLFTYRQVKPFDAALIRAVTQLFLMVPKAIVIIAITYVADDAITPNMLSQKWLPDDPLLTLAAIMGMWLLGFGFGLVTSVAKEFVPELDHIVKMMMIPLYYISGTLIPLSLIVPPEYQYIFVINPVVNGVELVRQGCLSAYHPLPGVSLAYLYAWAMGSMVLGVALHRRFSRKLVMK